MRSVIAGDAGRYGHPPRSLAFHERRRQPYPSSLNPLHPSSRNPFWIPASAGMTWLSGGNDGGVGQHHGDHGSMAL